MSLLDLDTALIPMARKIDLVYGPLVDAQEFPEEVDVTFIEGAVSTDEDVEKVQQIRQSSKIVVSLGDCAVTGNVAAMRNTIPVKKATAIGLRGKERPGRRNSSGESAAALRLCAGRCRTSSRSTSRFPAALRKARSSANCSTTLLDNRKPEAAMKLKFG